MAFGKKLSDFVADRSGNFAIMTALLCPVVIGSAGLALDVTSMLGTKIEFQAAADAASLAASSALGTGKTSKQQATTIAEQYLAGHMGSLGFPKYDKEIDIRSKKNLNGSTEWQVNVAVSAVHQNSGLGKVIGWGDQPISVQAGTVSISGLKTAFSMFFVLDKSGSMMVSTNQVKHRGACDYYWLNAAATQLYRQWRTPCYFTQMEALKNATNSMFDKFDKADPKHMYMRFGTVSFASEQEKVVPVSWGPEDAKTNINSLEAVGGTNSAEAFKTAVQAVTALTEVTAHTLKNGVALPKKYIVFMTDGENNTTSSDTKTLQQCAAAKLAGVTVYSIAFNAPAGGRELLSKCASSEKTFFDARDADALDKAFEQIAADAAGDMPRLNS